MKKFAIISISIVLLISVVCIAAFAFWDTTTGEITFTGSNIGSSITLKTDSTSTSNDGVGANKKLVSKDAVLGTGEAKLVSLAAVNIKLESQYTLAELQSLVKSIKFNVIGFSVTGVTSVSNTTYQNTFDLYLTTDSEGAGTKIFEGADFMNGFKANLKSGYKMYAFLKYKDDVKVDGATFAKKAINIKVEFVIA